MYLRYIAFIHKYARNRRTYLGGTCEGLWQRELQVPFLLYALCFSNLFPSILFESDQTILHVLLLCSWMFQILVGSVLCLAFFMPPIHLRCSVVWRWQVLCLSLRLRVGNSSSNKSIQECCIWSSVVYVTYHNSADMKYMILCVQNLLRKAVHVYKTNDHPAVLVIT